MKWFCAYCILGYICYQEVNLSLNPLLVLTKTLLRPTAFFDLSTPVRCLQLEITRGVAISLRRRYGNKWSKADKVLYKWIEMWWNCNILINVLIFNVNWCVTWRRYPVHTIVLMYFGELIPMVFPLISSPTDSTAVVIPSATRGYKTEIYWSPDVYMTSAMSITGLSTNFPGRYIIEFAFSLQISINTWTPGEFQ